jgi:hypothetical protein
MAKVATVNYTDGYGIPGKLIVDFSFEPADINQLFLVRIRYNVANLPSDDGYWEELKGSHEITAHNEVQQGQWDIAGIVPRPPLQSIKFVVQLFVKAHYFESGRFPVR